MSISISSPAFTEGGTIPKKFTCDAENLSPALTWSGIPQGTKSLVLIVDDPDAPVGVFVHWVLFGMAGNLTGLPEGVAKSDSVSGIGVQGINDFRKTGYDGPCPPKGSNHRYYFKLYALDTTLDLKTGARKVNVEHAMQGHILAQGQLMGRYGR
ncbi:MAG: YbhB/YbcL family Raf kinase inhibitor-like protein [Chloroflexi bacterium]|nr:YbhB/YbcL family Raf kinase inhibitor-like protein [Chloroflexota bacterium]